MQLGGMQIIVLLARAPVSLQVIETTVMEEENGFIAEMLLKRVKKERN